MRQRWGLAMGVCDGAAAFLAGRGFLRQRWGGRWAFIVRAAAL